MAQSHVGSSPLVRSGIGWFDRTGPGPDGRPARLEERELRFHQRRVQGESQNGYLSHRAVRSTPFFSPFFVVDVVDFLKKTPT